MALKIFDVHAHYQDSRYDNDRNEIFKNMNDAGVVGIIDSGDSVQSSESCIKWAQKYDFVYAAAGIHPHNVKDITEDDIVVLKELIRNPKVVAVGEIGLDYYYDDSAPPDVQKYWLLKQIELAAEVGKPIIFHDREAHEDSLEIIRDAASKGTTGIMHCFSGSAEMMREIIKYGFSISVGGVVTFKNAKKIIEVVQEVPIDRLFLETDCPYLAPEPFRGKRNDSSMILYIAQKVAEIKGMPVEELCDKIYDNCMRMFKI